MSRAPRYIITFIMFLIGISLCGCQSNSGLEDSNQEKIDDIKEE